MAGDAHGWSRSRFIRVSVVGSYWGAKARHWYGRCLERGSCMRGRARLYHQERHGICALQTVA